MADVATLVASEAPPKTGHATGIDLPDTTIHTYHGVKTVPSETQANVSSDAEADRKWQEAFDNTTEEQLDWLAQMMDEEEAKHGSTPLDFTGR